MTPPLIFLSLCRLFLEEFDGKSSSRCHVDRNAISIGECKGLDSVVGSYMVSIYAIKSHLSSIGACWKETEIEGDVACIPIGLAAYVIVTFIVSTKSDDIMSHLAIDDFHALIDGREGG